MPQSLLRSITQHNLEVARSMRTALPTIHFSPLGAGHDKPGRFCDLTRTTPIDQLERGQDFRHPMYRREVFLRFYEFHLKYRTHPGCVYFLLPYLKEAMKLDVEGFYWLAYINGNTQNPVTSYLIHREFPDVHSLDINELERWFNSEYKRLFFDMDRRYQKPRFVDAVQFYMDKVIDGQESYFKRVVAGGFKTLWASVREFAYFGRLSVWSYLEYLRIVGVDSAPLNLMLRDMSGSKSHRNGLAKVLGRDDLDWHKSNPTGFAGAYNKIVLEWLEEEADTLLDDARRRAVGRSWANDVTFFTLESALCTYKSWYRPNRRYPNVYADMLYERITNAEKDWGQRLELFWAARRDALPSFLRYEDEPRGSLAVSPDKQNRFILTGVPAIIGGEWPCFA